MKHFHFTACCLLVCVTLLSSVFSLEAQALSVSDLPEKVLLTGVGEPVPLKNIVVKTPLLVVVGSHKTISLLEALPFHWQARGWKLAPEQFLGVAAVSKAPWFVKTLFLRGSLTEAKRERDEQVAGLILGLERSKIIVDLEGDVATGLGVGDLGKGGYAAFILDGEGTITPLIRSEIPEGGEDQSLLKGVAEQILDLGEKTMSGNSSLHSY